MQIEPILPWTIIEIKSSEMQTWEVEPTLPWPVLVINSSEMQMLLYEAKKAVKDKDHTKALLLLKQAKVSKLNLMNDIYIIFFRNLNHKMR